LAIKRPNRAADSVARRIIRLERDTIVEATFEMRFQSSNAALSDLLPGIFFAEFKGSFPRVLRLPVSELPRQLQQADPELKYAPRQGIANDTFQILFGDFVLQISNRRPYKGWAEFKPMILSVLGVLESGNLIKKVERFSLKYTNVIEAKDVRDIKEQSSFIRLRAELGGHDLTSQLTVIRTEVHTRGYINIVEVAPTTKIRTSKDAQISGLMVSVDTIHDDPPGFFTNRESLLDAAHDMEKEIYFDILTQETIDRHGPVYG
jgi:uncharacterized protein (TIGR04255 family)